MSKGKKSLVKVVYGRTLIVLAIVLIQLAVLFSIYVFLMEYVTYIVGASTVLSAIVLLYITNEPTINLNVLITLEVSGIISATIPNAPAE